MKHPPLKQALINMKCKKCNRYLELGGKFEGIEACGKRKMPIISLSQQQIRDCVPEPSYFLEPVD